MEFHRKFHGIPWNSTEFRDFMEFHGIRFRQGMHKSNRITSTAGEVEYILNVYHS
jgi:hypothetical protein